MQTALPSKAPAGPAKGHNMFCSKCGAQMPEGTAFCSACGAPAAVATPQIAGAAPIAPQAVGYAPVAPAIPAAPTVAYAGFWLRFVAAIIDGFLLFIPLGPIFFIIFASVIPSFAHMEDPFEIMVALLPRYLLLLVIV